MEEDNVKHIKCMETLKMLGKTEITCPSFLLLKKLRRRKKRNTFLFSCLERAKFTFAVVVSRPGGL